MAIFLAIAFFIALSGYVISSFQSASSTGIFVEEVYKKQQATHALVSVLPMVLRMLDMENQKVDTLQDPWAFPFSIETDKGELEVVIYDEDRFLNLNLLASQPNSRIIERLFRLLNIEYDYLERLKIWTGVAPGEFRSKHPIKRRKLDSKYELEYIGFPKEYLVGRAIGDEFVPGLYSLVSVYSSGRVNLNTAPKHVLMSLHEYIDESLADRIVSYRSKKPFRKVQDIVLVEGITFDMLHSFQGAVDVKSRVFHIEIKIRVQGVESRLDVIYDRSAKRILYKELT
jgi:general secretion pathway protein K